MSGKTGVWVLALASSLALLGAGPAHAQLRNFGSGAYGANGYGMAPAPSNSFMPYGSFSPYGPTFGGTAPFGAFSPNIGRSFLGYATDNWNLFAINNLVWGDNYGVNWGTGYINPYVGAYGQSPYSMTDATLAQAQYYYSSPANALATDPAAILYAQQVQAAILNNPHVKVILPAATRGASPGQANYSVTGLIARDKLIDASGKVLWPASAPADGRFAAAREAAEADVKAAMAAFQKSGKVPAADVDKARKALAAYSTAALERLRTESPADAVGLEVFTQTLDQTLAALVPPAQVQPGVIEIPRGRRQAPGHA
jgi:hypothetical protein